MGSTFPGSSAVERRPVKATVAGPIPARGALQNEKRRHIMI